MHQSNTSNPPRLTALQSGEQYLFNQQNLEHFSAAISEGIKLIQKTFTNKQQPFTGIKPQELAKHFAELKIDQPLASINEVLEEIEKLYLNDAVYFHLPQYMAHLNCPIVYPTILAELILSSVNSSMDTWDQSAGATLIEQSLIDWTNQLIGYSPQADGIFTSGGTQSNLMALLLARDDYCQKLSHSNKNFGLPNNANRFRIFTSAISHFSVQKSAAILGLGYGSVVSVAYDDQYQMNPQQLEHEIKTALEEGLIPIAVVATAGTTDFGSIDPLPEISAICQKYNLWMHVDAAYGCGCLLSQSLAKKLNGIEQADSVTVDYHKSFFQAVSCGSFLVKDSSKLATVTHHAEYLNPLAQSLEGTPNLVNKSIQTTRRFDALKLWLSLRTIGKQSMGEMFEQLLELAQLAHQHLTSFADIEVIHQPSLSTLVFRYVPQNSRVKNPKMIDELNELIRKRIFTSGLAAIASTKIDDTKYLKFTLLNPTTNLEQIAQVTQLIRSHGELISQEHHLFAQQAV